jgi:hypothetical protein
VSVFGMTAFMGDRPKAAGPLPAQKRQGRSPHKLPDGNAPHKQTHALGQSRKTVIARQGAERLLLGSQWRSR